MNATGSGAWVNYNISGFYVIPNGTYLVNSPWDEGGREVGIYSNGYPVALVENTHGWAVCLCFFLDVYSSFIREVVVMLLHLMDTTFISEPPKEVRNNQHYFVFISQYSTINVFR